MKTLSIATTGRDNLYTLAYMDSEPETAKRVVQSLVSIFVESSLGASRKDTATATTFLNEQIKSYEAKLEEAESRLKEFRLRNIEMMASDGKDSTARLGELTRSWSAPSSSCARRRTPAMRRATQLSGEQPGRQAQHHAVAAAGVGDFRCRHRNWIRPHRREAHKRNLDGLLQRYTDQAPRRGHDCASFIRDLEEQKQEAKWPNCGKRGDDDAGQFTPRSNNSSSLAAQELGAHACVFRGAGGQR